METKTRVLIADTNDDFKRLMTEVLRNEEDLELVGCVGDGVDALAMVAESKPDVLVLDLVLAKLDGIERGANKTTVPTALKNPNALTIKIGGTTVTYDGSAAKTVTIADGSEVAY